MRSNDLGVNSYIRKPVGFEEFHEVIARLAMYWLMINRRLPISKIC